jgi:hypothetical protein
MVEIYLPCIIGLVPDDIVHAVAAFLKFCYITRQASITAKDLGKLEDTGQNMSPSPASKDGDNVDLVDRMVPSTADVHFPDKSGM